MTVFPPRDLPGRGEAWGREVESRVNQSLRGVQRLQQALGNSSRSSSGQLASTSELIDELSNRAMDIAAIPNMSVTGTATVAPFPTTTYTHTFPATPGLRTGFLMFNGVSSVSPLRSTSSVVFLRYQGRLLTRLLPDLTGYAAIDPVESSNRGEVTGFCRMDLPDDGPVPIEIQFSRGPDSVSSTVTLSNITLALTRSGIE